MTQRLPQSWRGRVFLFRRDDDTLILARNAFCLADCSTGKKRWANLFKRNPIKISLLVNGKREKGKKGGKSKLIVS